MCLKSEDIFFQGTLISPVHNYFHFEILECKNDLLRLIPGYEDESCFSELEVETFYNNSFLLGYVSNSFVDQDIYGESPVKSLNDLVFYEQLNYKDHIRKEIMLNYNVVQLKDNYFQVWDRF